MDVSDLVTWRKKELIREIVRLQRELAKLQGHIDALRSDLDEEKEANLDLSNQYRELVASNERRLDELMAGQKAIVDQRLGLSLTPRIRKEGDEGPKPVGRKQWKHVAADYEAEQRKQYWSNYIKAVEAGQASAGNDTRIAPSPEPTVEEEVAEIADDAPTTTTDH